MRKQSASLGLLSSYCNAFTKFLKISILLENSIDNVQDFEETYDNDLLEFCQSHYEFDNVDEMFDEIKKFDIRKQQKTKYQNKHCKYWHLFTLA